MGDELVRQELPIQSVKERDWDCHVVVPVHLSVMRLPSEIRADVSLLRGAREEVQAAYNEDMAYHLSVIGTGSDAAKLIHGYESFQQDWVLRGEPDSNGFLELKLEEKTGVHSIKFLNVPVILSNQHDESGAFYVPETFLNGREIEIIYRRLGDSDSVAMAPDKMRKYGLESEIAKIEEARGVASVVANAFCSDYHANMAMPLLLRSFAVFYLNKLLKKAESVVRN